MADIKFKGSAAHTIGNLPKVGTPAPGIQLVKTDLSPATLETYAGKTLILNIFPSVDTPVCAASVRAFNAEVSRIAGTVVLNISMDLPFAQKRFCGAEGLANVEMLSAFRSSIGKDYGLTLIDSPLVGLLARAVLVIGVDGTVRYAEQVADIASEPNYRAALAAIG